MTIERAKQIAKQWANGYVCSFREGEMEEYHKMCLLALRAQKELETNEPLTVDELREMDGEPVWIVWSDGRIKSKWWIVGNYDWRMMEFDEWRDYGKTWVAYRRKPEEGDLDG